MSGNLEIYKNLKELTVLNKLNSKIYGIASDIVKGAVTSSTVPPFFRQGYC